MKTDYRRLTENELDTFINMRINQLREEGAKEEIDLVPALKTSLHVNVSINFM